MIYILNREGTRILDVLDNQGDNIYWDDKASRTIHNTEKYEFKVPPNSRAARHLGKRNRVIIQSGDGFFHEFIIITTVQQRDSLEVYTVGAQLEIAEDEPFPELKREGDTINTILDYALSRSRWKRGVTEFTQTIPFDTDGYKTPLQIINRAGALFDVELRFRVDIDPGGNRIKGRYVDALKKRPPFRGKEIVHGKDLINVTNTDDYTEVHTALRGIATIDEEEVSVVVKNENARMIWGIDGKHRWDVYEPQNEEENLTVGQLQYFTEQELNKRIASVIEYEVDAVDLEAAFGYSHEKIRLGDKVRVIADDYNPPIYLEARVIAEEYSVADPTKRKFTLGDFIEFDEFDVKAAYRDIRRKVAKKAGKVLYDENGEESGGLNGVYDNFGSLYIADLSSPTVPIKSQADIKLYVSDRVINAGNPPSNENDGQSFDNPLETIEEALRRCPEQLNHEFRIVLAYDGDFYERIKIRGISGSGKIVINGQYKWGTTVHNGVQIRGTQAEVELREFLTITESTYEVFSTNAGTTKMYDCAFKGTQTGTIVTEHGILPFDNGTVIAENCSVYDVKHCIYTYDGGEFVNKNNKGSGTRFGLQARTGGIISGYGTAPGGSVANINEIDGGDIKEGSMTFDEATDQSEPVSGTVTKEYPAINSDSYQPDNWDSTTNDVLQGQWGSAGPYWGAWFFGNAPSDDVTGKEIVSMKLKCKRANSSGSGGAVDVLFRAHSYPTKPAGAPGFSGTSHAVSFKRGEPRTVNIPSSVYADFESGVRKGFGIYSGSSNYVRMMQDAVLEITYKG